VHHLAVQVRILAVLDNKDRQQWKRKSKGHIEVDDAGKTPTINHLGVGIHVNLVVYGCVEESQGEQEVLGQVTLQGSGTVLSEQELLHHFCGLDHCLCNC
jgi:hypothetical protein